jgi:hypothetical protein
MNIRYRLVWDNPYWLFCDKGQLMSYEDKSNILRFEILTERNAILFYEKNKPHFEWRWKDRYETGVYNSPVRSGELFSFDEQLLAKTNAFEPKFIRKNGVRHCTVLKITTDIASYFINWDTTFWFKIIAQNDIMTLCDENENVIIKSITPPLGNDLYMIGTSCEPNILLSIFIAYHIKIPMMCIGD